MYGQADPYAGAHPSWFTSAPGTYRRQDEDRWQGHQEQQRHGWQQGQPLQTHHQQERGQHQQQDRHHQQLPPEHRQQQQQQQQLPQHRHHQQPLPQHRQQHHSSTPPYDSRPHKRARAEQQQARLPPPQQQPRQQRAGAPWLDTLQHEVMQFAQEAVPTKQEEQQRQAVLSSFEGVVQAVLGRRQQVNTMLFGSARAGLALHSSDLDIVITGLCSPDGPNGGYDRYGKQQVVRHLRLVEQEAFRRMQLRTSKLIAHARIPVLKLETRSGVELDCSVNDASSVSAANFLQSWQEDFVVLRPLVLVLKSILKQNSLGDVAFGGLGSWSLANMCIAHLMAEDGAGGQVDHAGHMLFSFLKRFGVDWDINKQAVAVAQGGIVSRASLASAAGPFAGPDKLAVKDPLTGREVAGGSHRYADVARLWRQLYHAMRDRGPAAAARAAGGQYKVLSVVVDCDVALQRAGAQQRGSRGDGGGGYSAAHAMPQDDRRKRRW